MFARVLGTVEVSVVVVGNIIPKIIAMLDDRETHSRRERWVDLGMVNGWAPLQEWPHGRFTSHQRDSLNRYLLSDGQRELLSVRCARIERD